MRKNTVPTSKEQDPVKSELGEGPKAKLAKQHRAMEGRKVREVEGRGEQ